MTDQPDVTLGELDSLARRIDELAAVLAALKGPSSIALVTERPPGDLDVEPFESPRGSAASRRRR